MRSASSDEGRVGIDVEAERDFWPSLAQRCLAPSELAWLATATSGRSRQERFFRLWTAKEAY